MRLIADAEEQRYDALTMGHGLEKQTLLSAVTDREPVCPMVFLVFVGHPGTVTGVSAAPRHGFTWSLNVFPSGYPEITLAAPSTLIVCLRCPQLSLESCKMGPPTSAREGKI